MKNKEIKSKLCAMGLAASIASTFTGCQDSNDNEVKEPINSDNYTEGTTLTTIENIEQITSAVVKDNGGVELLETTVPNDKVVFEGNNNVYVESANEVNIYFGYENSTDYQNVNVVTESVQNVETSIFSNTTILETETPVVLQTTVPTTAQTTAQTTAPTTVQTTMATTTTTTAQASYKKMDLVCFEELSEQLLAELNRHKIYKAKNTKFTRKDMYAMVYIVNIDFISDELKQTLINKGYIADDIETIYVNCFSVEEAVDTYNKSRLKWNTNMDEICFGLDYFKNDPTVYFEVIDDTGVYEGYNSNSKNFVHSNVTDKLDKVSSEEYYDARAKFYNKYNINQTFVEFSQDAKKVYKDFIGRDSYQFNDFCDYSVAINDLEAKQTVQNALKLAVKASLNNEDAYKTLNDFYMFDIGKKKSTTLVECGAGSTYITNSIIYCYVQSLVDSEYKSLRGYTKDNDEYKQALIRVKKLAETTQDLSDVVRIHKGCEIQLTK